MSKTSSRFLLPLHVIVNILLAYVCYEACRLAFIAKNWSLLGDSLSWASFWQMSRGGLLFDTAAICFTNCLYLLLALQPFGRGNRVLRQVTKWVFLIPNIVAVVINLMDSAYFSFTQKRVTANVFAEFQNEGNLGSIIGVEFIHNWYFVLLAAVLLVLLVKGYRPASAAYEQQPVRRYVVTQVVCLLLTAFLVVCGARGSSFRTATRPISPNDAFRYANQPIETNVVLNTPFNILKTLKHKTVDLPTYFADQAELDSLYSPLHLPRPDRIERRKNVVVLIVESFAEEFIGSRNRYLDNGTYQGYTPFADSLLAHSLTYRETFCNSWTSIDAMPAVLASIPRIHDPFVLSPFSLNKINSLATELGQWGYESAFFHGAENNSMGFRSFARSAGFGKYYGRTEFYADERFGGEKEFDGTWGIWDEPFLQFFCTKMTEMQEPFVTAVFTLSSHHPFAIPEKYKDVFKDEGIHALHKCIRYTDYSLRRFFESARQQPWYSNTIFVLCADHASSKTTHAEYKTELGHFRVPILFFDPSGELPVGCVDGIAQQIDIMPTLLNYLGYDQPYIAFGKDLFHTPPADTWAFNYFNVPQLIRGNHLLQFDGHQTTGFYDYRKDSLLQHNIKGQEPDESSMERQTKAIIQSLMQRMKQNSITYKKE
ncbi:MAG: sulfatase-like hydrolase/transferase [Bacteroidaceae bacterium]|nr:sulfatase-like hydrolase/transferase [Bacteroidaceae bacterium]